MIRQAARVRGGGSALRLRVGARSTEDRARARAAAGVKTGRVTHEVEWKL